MSSEIAQAYVTLKLAMNEFEAQMSGVARTAETKGAGIADSLYGAITGRLSEAFGAVDAAIEKIGKRDLGGAFETLGTAISKQVGDGISGGFKGVGNLAGGAAGALGSLVGIGNLLESSISGVFGTIGGVIGGTVEQVGSAMSRMVGFITDGFTGPIAKALSSHILDTSRMVEAAIHAEAVQAKLSAVLTATGGAAGWTADQLARMGRELAGSGQHSGAQVKEAQTALLAFRNVHGEQFREALVQSQNLAALWGGDLASSARHLGMALENPEHAARLLRSAGAELTDQQQRQIEVMTKTGDVAGAQEIILQQLAGSVGGVAAAMATTVEGRLNKLAQTWQGIGLKLGEAFMPGVSALVDGAQYVVSGLASVLEPAFAKVTAFAARVVGDVRGFFGANQAAFGQWGRGVQDVVLSAVATAEQAWSGLSEFFTTTVARWMTQNGITWANIKSTVTGALDTIATALGDIPGTSQIVWNKVQIAALEAWDMIQARWVEARASWSGTVAAIRSYWESFVDWFFGTGPAVYESLTGELRAMVDGAWDAARDLTAALTSPFTAMAEAVAATAPAVAATLRSLVESASATAQGYADSAAKTAEVVGAATAAAEARVAAARAKLKGPGGDDRTADEKAAAAFRNAYNDFIVKNKSAEENPLIKALLDQIDDAWAKMEAKKKQREKDEQTRKNNEAQGQGGEGGPGDGPYTQRRAGGYEFTGVEQLSRQIQQSLTPGSDMVGLAKQSLQIQTKMAAGIDRLNEKVGPRRPSDDKPDAAVFGE